MPGTAPTPSNYSSLVNELVLPEFMDTEWDLTKRRRVYLDYLENSGSIQNDGSGKYMDWLARIGEFQTGYSTDLGVRDWARKNHHVTYTAPWAPIEVRGVLSEMDVMFLESSAARTARVRDMVKQMCDDFYKDINSRLLNENASSNTVSGISAFSGSQVPFYGLPTVFGYGTAAIGYNPDTKASTSIAVAATDKEVLANVSYCGVSTHPLNSISGVNDKVNESTSPVIANWTSTAWVTSSGTTWVLNAVNCMEHLIQRVGRDSDVESKPNLGLLTPAMWRDFRTAIRRNSTIDIVLQDNAPRAPDAGMYPRFFIPFLGVNFHDDHNQPTNTVYVLNTRKIKLRIFPQAPAGFNDGPFSTEGVKKRLFSVRQAPDIDQGAYKVLAKMVAQMICMPNQQGMAFNAA